MTLVESCLLFVFLYVGTLLGPGLFFVRGRGWQPLETLVASIALSVVLLYLVSFGSFAAGVLRTSSYAVSAVAWGMTLWCVEGRALPLAGSDRPHGLDRVRRAVRPGRSW